MRVPIRVQRQRTRGWRMPAHTKYVGRGSLFGNPYRVARTRRELDAGDPMVVATPEEAVERFREWIAHTREGRHVRDSAQRLLWGLDLACWCPPRSAVPRGRSARDREPPRLGRIRQPLLPDVGPTRIHTRITAHRREIQHDYV